MTDSLLITIFVSFPEAIIIMLLGLNLCNIKIELKKVLVISVIQAMISYLIEVINVSFGMHTIIMIISLCILISLIMKIKLHKVIVASLIGFFSQGIIQMGLVSISNAFIKIDIGRLGVEFLYTFIFSLVIFTISLFILYIIKRTNFSFCDLSREGEFIDQQE